MANNERIKHIMYGAGLQFGTKNIDNAIWNAANKKAPSNPAPWWYTNDFGFPRDALLLDLGLPAALGIAGMVTKKRTLKDMAIGAALTGIADFMSMFWYRTWQWPWLPFKTAQMPNDKLIVGTPVGCPEAGKNADKPMLFV